MCQTYGWQGNSFPRNDNHIKVLRMSSLALGFFSQDFLQIIWPEVGVIQRGKESSSVFSEKRITFLTYKITSIFLQNICNWNCDPGACHSQANIEARLAQRKVGFTLDASNQGEGQTSILRLNPPPWQQVDNGFYRQRDGVTWENSTVSSDSHLEIGHWWPYQHHLDCFK